MVGLKRRWCIVANIFSLYNIMLWRFQQIRWNWNWMVHTRFWFMLIMLIPCSTIKKSMYTFIRLVYKVSAKENKLLFVFRDHNAGQNHNMKIGDKSFESVTEFKHLGAAQKTRIAFMKKLRAKRIHGLPATLKSRIFCLTVCYQKIYRTIIVPLVLHGCETCLWQWGRNIGWRCWRIG